MRIFKRFSLVRCLYNVIYVNLVHPKPSSFFFFYFYGGFVLLPSGILQFKILTQNTWLTELLKRFCYWYKRYTHVQLRLSPTMSIYFLTYKPVTLTYKLIVRLVSLVVLVMRLGVQGALMGPLSDDRPPQRLVPRAFPLKVGGEKSWERGCRHR